MQVHAWHYSCIDVGSAHSVLDCIAMLDSTDSEVSHPLHSLNRDDIEDPYMTDGGKLLRTM